MFRACSGYVSFHSLAHLVSQFLVFLFQKAHFCCFVIDFKTSRFADFLHDFSMSATQVTTLLSRNSSGYLLKSFSILSNAKHLFWNHFYWRRHLKAPHIPKDYHDEHDNSSYDNPKGFWLWHFSTHPWYIIWGYVENCWK